MDRDLARKFDALVAVYSGPVFVIDAEGTYLEVIEGTDSDGLLYEDADTLEGQRFHDVLPESTADRFLETVRAVLADGDPTVIEYTLDVEAGPRWFEASVSPIPSPETEGGRVVWAAREITERKRRERALTELHDVATRLATSDSVDEICRQTIDAADAILDFDRSLVAIEEDGVLRVRATSEQIPPGETREMPTDSGIAGKTYRTGKSFLVDDFEACDEADPQGPFRSGLSLPIGEHGNFQAVATEPGAFDESDRELGELLAAQTAVALTRIRQERDLQRQNERLDEFASVVSHDLRNPLNVASVRLGLAMDDCDSEHLAEVRKAHDRIKTMVDDLLALARSGDRIEDPGPVPFAEVVEECWSTVETGGATLVVDTGRTIRADGSRLRQLLENLLRNAVEHGGADVTITVGDLEDGFYVEDDGSGLPEDAADRLFESGDSTSDGGAGLGLSIVEGIAEAHDWAVEATESDDGGARFEFRGVEFVP